MSAKYKSLTILMLISLVLTIAFLIWMNIYQIPDNTHVRIADLEKVSFKQLSEDLDDGMVTEIFIAENSTEAYVILDDGTCYKTQNPNNPEFEYDAMKKGAFVSDIREFESAERYEKIMRDRRDLGLFVGVLISCLCLTIMIKDYINGERVLCFSRTPALAGANPVNISTPVSSKSEEAEETTIKHFSDVAGLHEVKRDVTCLVDFLQNKEKYHNAGAVLPKGIILYGPPGTGKTLLAKAIAGEAGVPFFYASGSDFVEMYVGVGAKRIRDLFTNARRQSPCIVFIDEIDAIGGRRRDIDNSEDHKTINALLTEMDGFNELDSVLVIGATNRMEDLDPALTRPGRFTDKFCVPLPENSKERLEIITLYSKNKYFSEDFSMEDLAKETVGFSPAQLESLLNEAAIIQVQEDKAYINKQIIDKAMFKVLLNGHEKRDPDRNREELEVVAWHEAGHALVGKLFGKDITKVTVVKSTSGAGGVTFSTPTKTQLLSKDDLVHEVMELYAGRIGELYYYNGDYNKVTTGASNDIERATIIIYNYIVRYGMADSVGMINLEVCNANRSSYTKAVSDMAKKIEDDTRVLVESNKDLLQELATELIEHETIYSDDVDRIVKVERRVSV